VTFAEALFAASLVGAAYSYFLYPLILLLLTPGVRPMRVAKAPGAVRSITVIIAARNEIGKIEAKLANTLALENPGVPVEVLVASDASDDGTDEIVLRHADNGVRLSRTEERRGKEYAQSRAIAASSGDIIVFTDAGTTLPADSLKHIMAAFADQGVGAVSSVDRLISADGQVHGEGLYLRYEMWLRDLETRFGSLVGLSGSFFAARREVCKDWDVFVPSDFGTALNCVRHGFRAVSDRNVIGLYKNIADPRREYQRKLRTISRGMTGLKRRAEVLSPFRFGRFAFQVFSHKAMRWAVPWFLLTAFVTNAILVPTGGLYPALFVAQIALYVLALLARLIPALTRVGPIRLWSFFVEVNAAIFHASLRVMRGQTMLTWDPSKR
jgi:cellulose synthase/poly-beta-1,6-N-acetylglucosamine synthase-like glycosyltransferase